MSAAYQALVLDLDGTLVTDEGRIHPRTLAALQALHARGVRVMIATGRSELGVVAVLEELAMDTPAVVFNGAGLYCPVERRLLEERLLSDRVVARCFEFAEKSGLMPLIQVAGAKYAPHPRDEHEALALRGLEGLRHVDFSALPREYVIRVTFFSRAQDGSAAVAAEVQRALAQPLFITHFPLNALATHRASQLAVVDVQPPSRGKGEALRVLAERYGIARERVVAVGDADNDLEMITAAGLGVAMQNSMPRVLAAAGRVIGPNNSDTIAELVAELF
ncbi:MAG: Cof-type HAD-IIB family hydrolase [Planctomycetes bacterium]|nr:Cof-type HAD-IIB family hydrolase [Planctomycetota bacterium]